MNVNKAIIVGNITRDPELKALPSGVQVCSFSVATNEVYTKDNEKVEKTEFHNIVSFGKLAENIAKYMKKGSQIYVEGKIQTRSWEADGIKKYRTEIVAQNVQFGSKPKGSSNESVQGNIEDDGDWENDQAKEDVENGIDPNDIPF